MAKKLNPGSLPPQVANKPPTPPPAEPKGLADYLGDDAAEQTPAAKSPSQSPPSPPPDAEKDEPKGTEASPPVPPTEQGADKSTEQSGQESGEPTAKAETEVGQLLDQISKPSQKQPERPAEQLRNAYERLKAEHTEYKQSVETKIKALEERNAKLEQALYALDYTKSDEYKNNYLKPIEDNYGSAVRLVTRLQTEDGTRLGTAEDVEEIYQLWRRSPTRAIAAAKELFGAAGDRVVDAVASIADATERSIKASQEAERIATERARQKEEKVTQLWQTTIRSVEETYPDFFKFDNNPELDAIAKKCAAMADAAFLGANGLSDEDLIKLRANVRTMAAAFGPLAHERQQLRNKVAELEKELEQFRSSAPKVKAGQAAGETKPKKKTGLEALDDYLGS